MGPATGHPEGDARATAPTAPADGRGVVRAAGSVVVAVVLGCVLLALLVGAGSASVPAGNFNASNDTSNDTTAPSVGNLTTVDETTVNLTITDDEDVDEGSIDGADVFVSDGQIDNVTATEDGSNATVEIDLDARLNTDRLGVAVADGASIYDEAGNEIDSDGDVWRYVDGMDSVAPSVKLYEVDNGSGDTVDVTVRTSEDLDDLRVRLYGPADRWLTLANFTKPSGIAEYVASVEPPATGEYRVTLVNVTDLHNNTWESSRAETVDVDVVPPTAVAGIDFAASDGRTIAFDANRSSDDSGIRNLTWDFGDGTNATAWQPTHTFEPGNYTVTLTVTDTFGHEGTDRLRLNLTHANASAALVGDAGVAPSVSSPDGDTSSALVQVPPTTAGDAVEIARGGDAPLAAARSVSLDRLSVTLARNDSFGLAVQATGAEPVADVADASGGPPLGGLTVVHDVPDDAISGVQFSFAVADERLAERDVDPQALGLYRHHGGGWTALSTTYLNESDGRHRYRASAPGLSRFAIAPAGSAAAAGNATDDTDAATETTSTPPPDTPQGPQLGVATASLNRSAIAPGEAVAVNATVRNRGSAAGAMTAALTVDGQAEATRNVSLDAGNARSIQFVVAPNATGEYAVAVGGTGAGTLTVGESGPGLLGFLGVLPLDLLGTLVRYLGGVLAALFLLLKAVALFLGY